MASKTKKRKLSLGPQRARKRWDRIPDRPRKVRKAAPKYEGKRWEHLRSPGTVADSEPRSYGVRRYCKGEIATDFPLEYKDVAAFLWDVDSLHPMPKATQDVLFRTILDGDMLLRNQNEVRGVSKRELIFLRFETWLVREQGFDVHDAATLSQYVQRNLANHPFYRE